MSNLRYFWEDNYQALARIRRDNGIFWTDGMPVLPGQIVYDGGLPQPLMVTKVDIEGVWVAEDYFFGKEEIVRGTTSLRRMDLGLHSWYRRTKAEPMECRNCGLYYADPRAAFPCHPAF